MRQDRKIDHVRLAQAEGSGGAGFGDVALVHNSLPELALDEIDLSTELLGVRLSQPVIINAMTGGAREVTEINWSLARMARRLGLAMAVGSQRAGLQDPDVRDTYAVVRTENPDGIVLANLGAGATPDEVQAAMDMVQADIIQLHLNAPQELVMPEGDRDFRGQAAAIGAVAAGFPRLVVKECGFGISRETARRLYGLGVRAVDVAGYGGTNFVRIEAKRAGRTRLDPGLAGWGIPTACSLAEVLDLGLQPLDVVASGGISRGVEAARALAMGAAAVGVAGPALRALQGGGEAGLEHYLKEFLHDLHTAVLLTGARDLPGLRRVPIVIRGEVAEWCLARGINTRNWARR